MSVVYEFIDFFYNGFGSARALFYGTYTERIVANTWNLFRQLWIYVLIGALMAVVVGRMMNHRWMRRFLTRGGRIPIIAASVIGVVSPMCTFAAIPLVGGLLAVGVPLPPLMAFLVASPLMNPSLFIVTWGGISPEMAVMRLLSAMILGITAGLITELALTRSWRGFADPLRSKFSVAAQESPSCACSTGDGRSLLRETYSMTGFVAKYFFLALIIAGTVQAVISPRWIAVLLGGSGFSSIIAGGLLGIPLYVCGGGTVALINVLVSMGMGQGAALAFFITGPATKISTLISLNAVLSKKVAAVYLAVTILGGMLIGWGYSHVERDFTVDYDAFGVIESIEDAVLYKPGLGSPTGD